MFCGTTGTESLTAATTLKLKLQVAGILLHRHPQFQTIEI